MNKKLNTVAYLYLLSFSNHVYNKVKNMDNFMDRISQNPWLSGWIQNLNYLLNYNRINIFKNWLGFGWKQ
jgi:hypothetical protein